MYEKESSLLNMTKGKRGEGRARIVRKVRKKRQEERGLVRVRVMERKNLAHLIILDQFGEYVAVCDTKINNYC